MCKYLEDVKKKKTDNEKIYWAFATISAKNYILKIPMQLQKALQQYYSLKACQLLHK
jgi:hypothetical protein